MAVAKFLKTDTGLQMDFCSCVTGGGLPESRVTSKWSIIYIPWRQKQGPVILKVRAPRELEQCGVPSLTPVWRGCEFQEREAFDLYGVRFDGHPDLRRILMWDEFADHPMRKDYVPPAGLRVGTDAARRDV